MNLEQVLPPGSVVLDVDAADKAAAISRVANMLATASGVPAAVIEAAVVAREALGSTGVGGGIALPHARLRSLRGTHAVFLRTASPLGFDAIDGKPVDLVCGVIAPGEPAADLLTAVSAMSRVLRDAGKTAALRAAPDAEAARAILFAG